MAAFSLAGALLLRQQGRQLVQAIRDAAVPGEGTGGGPLTPSDHAEAGVLSAAGILLTVPGLVTGVAGALLWSPALRSLAIRSALRRAAARRATRSAGGAVVRGEVVEPERPAIRPDDPD